MADDLTFKVEIEPGVIQSMGEQASGIIRAIAFSIEGEMKRSMSTPKRGRFYRRSKRGAAHQASAPGEAPAIDSGLLANSIQTAVVSPLLAQVRIGAEYASYLEFGTRRMSPRPYVQPAIDAISKQQGGILRSARP